MLIMLKLAPFFKAKMGTFAEGITVKDDPIQISKSQELACLKAFVKSFKGSFYPK